MLCRHFECCYSSDSERWCVLNYALWLRRVIPWTSCGAGMRKNFQSRPTSWQILFAMRRAVLTANLKTLLGICCSTLQVLPIGSFVINIALQEEF